MGLILLKVRYWTNNFFLNKIRYMASFSKLECCIFLFYFEALNIDSILHFIYNLFLENRKTLSEWRLPNIDLVILINLVIFYQLYNFLHSVFAFLNSTKFYENVRKTGNKNAVVEFNFVFFGKTNFYLLRNISQKLDKITSFYVILPSNRVSLFHHCLILKIDKT